MKHNEWKKYAETTVKELGGEIDWTGKTHAHATFDNGKRITVPCTPSDHRAAANFRADCERASGAKVSRTKAGKYQHRSSSSFRDVAPSQRSPKQDAVADLWAVFVDTDGRMQSAASVGNSGEFSRLYPQWRSLADRLFDLVVETPDEWKVRSSPPVFMRRALP